jgi:mercuric ion transport protein
MTSETDNEMAVTKASRANGWLAGGGLLSGAFAFLGASCCVLPIMLVNLGVSSALVANLGFFARYKTNFMVAAALLLAGAIVFALRGVRRPKFRFWISVAVAVSLLAGASLLPSYEGELLRWLNLK